MTFAAHMNTALSRDSTVSQLVVRNLSSLFSIFFEDRDVISNELRLEIVALISGFVPPFDALVVVGNDRSA